MDCARSSLLLPLLGLLPLALPLCAQDWPMGAGPHGNWTTDGKAPVQRFSGATGQNIRWRTPMPETGQGGIAVVGDRLYVATMAPWDGNGLDAADAAKFAHATEKRKVVGKHIDGHCLDVATCEILWSRRIEGSVPSIYSYPFSDATSSSPVADGQHVWFTNAGGQVICFTRAGEEVWHRTFEPTIDGPFNKQFEPFLVDDPCRGEGKKTLVHMEPRPAPDGGSRWHYLIGLDAATGTELWQSEDALTHYNCPLLTVRDGVPCVLHARGGPHDVPERPVGMSLTRVAGPDAGKRVWRYEDARGNHEGALQTMACDDRNAYWLLKEPHNVLVLVDVHTGEELRAISLVQGVHTTLFAADRFVRTTQDLKQGVFPARYSMHASGGALFFQCYATAWGKPTIDPGHCFARITVGEHAGQDRVDYLEVPTECCHGPDTGEYLFRREVTAKAVNSRGVEVTGDERSHWDGWDWVFNGSPTQVGSRLYFTLAPGTVYVVDATAGAPFESAFLALNDLGQLRETWTANSVTYAQGLLFHRTARELLCIGEPR